MTTGCWLTLITGTGIKKGSVRDGEKEKKKREDEGEGEEEWRLFLLS